MSAGDTLRTVFMGTPEIAVPSLRALAELSDVQLVVTQPDRRAGRGRKMQAPPVKQAAEELGIEVWQPESLKGNNGEFLAEIDLVVVLAYGELLRQAVLAAPHLGCINLHASLLPRWRGASPLQSVIKAGDVETGVTVMRMVRALDAGAMFHQRRIPLDDSTTLPWLHDSMAEESALALRDFFNDHLYTKPVEQNPDLVTYCGKLTPADGALDWSASMAELDRWVRAYEPAPGCWTSLANGERLRIRALAPLPTASHALQPGQVLVESKRLLVGCGDGVVSLLEVQPQGKRSMDAVAYLNGNEAPEFFGKSPR